MFQKFASHRPPVSYKLKAKITVPSEYPEQRCRVDGSGAAYGVPGSLRRLQRALLSPQPINAWQWNRDHTGLAITTSYDQQVRVIVTTKLNLQ